MLFPETVWRIHKRKHTVYLTFDDGPIPEVTPWVLDVLDHYGVKATFFCVGDNVARNPELFAEIKRRGHSVGNHTMNHLQGAKVTTRRYLLNVYHAHELIDSPLFRPPHGLLRWAQSKVLRSRFTIIMYDLVTRDYSKKMTPEQVLGNVKRRATCDMPCRGPSSGCRHRATRSSPSASIDPLPQSLIVHHESCFVHQATCPGAGLRCLRHSTGGPRRQ